MVVEWIGIGLLAVAQLAGWWRNGRAKSEEYGALKKEIDVINKKLDHPEHGTEAIHKEVATFQKNCADISGRVDERVKANERRISRLENGASRRGKTR
jgi:predicted  nucleic acid-binding Zn-ribbon protein